MKVEPILVWDRVQSSAARLRREATNARQVLQFHQAAYLMEAGQLVLCKFFASVFAPSCSTQPGRFDTSSPVASSVVRCWDWRWARQSSRFS
jgi:hypothetical protein